MSDSSEQSEWIPVAEAAAAARLPVRTVYNWVTSTSITSHKREGITCVRPADVLARARERESAQPQPEPLPALSANTATPASDAGAGAITALTCTTQPLPPDLLAHFIRLFEQGVPLPNVVEQLRLPTALALEARRQYDQLVAAGGQPSLVERMTAIAQQLDARMAQIEVRLAESEQSNATATRQLADELYGAVQPRQAELEQRLAKLSAIGDQAHRQLDAAISDLYARYSDFTSWVTDFIIRQLRR